MYTGNKIKSTVKLKNNTSMKFKNIIFYFTIISFKVPGQIAALPSHIAHCLTGMP